MGCPEGLTKKSDETQCTGGVCSNDDCCNPLPTCGGQNYECPQGRTPKSESTPCTGGKCSDATCCVPKRASPSSDICLTLPEGNCGMVNGFQTSAEAKQDLCKNGGGGGHCVWMATHDEHGTERAICLNA